MWSCHLAVEEIEEHKSKLPRQFVNFTFYRARPEWRLLEEAEKLWCKEDFANAIDAFRKDLLIHTYSTVGLRTDTDFMIWRIGYDLEPMQEMTGRLNSTSMAKYIEPMKSYLSMNKRSIRRSSCRHRVLGLEGSADRGRARHVGGYPSPRPE